MQSLVDNAYWRLNKINDYNPFKEGLTKVELIKVLDVFNQPNEVFTLGTQGSNNGEKYPTNKHDEKLNRNQFQQFTGDVKGRRNKVNDSATSYKIIGDDNYIGPGSENITILGSGNEVINGASNVVIINSDNQKVAANNVTIIDGKVYANWTHVDATANYTTSNREVVSCNASSGAFTVTLPTLAADNWVSIKKTDSANAITITTPDATNIDGALSITLTTRYEAVDLYCSDKVWLIR